MLKKLIWLVAGLVVGIGLSSTFAADYESHFGKGRSPANYRFKVVAVSVEDANDRASEMLKDGELKGEIDTQGLVSANRPVCREDGLDYGCEVRLNYRTL